MQVICKEGGRLVTAENLTIICRECGNEVKTEKSELQDSFRRVQEHLA
jgi:hypothetical protein